MKRQVLFVMVICLLSGRMAMGGLLYQFSCTDGVATSGGVVTSWANQGGAGGAALASSSGPTVSSQVMPGGNTMNVLSFDGVGSYLDVSADSSLDVTQLTWFIVYKAVGDTSEHASLLRSAYASGATSNAGLMWGSYVKADTDGDVISHSRSSTGTLVQRTNTNTSVDNWYIVMGAWTSTTGVRQWVMDSSGTITYSGGTASGANASPTGHILTRIGAASTAEASGFFEGYIAEIRIYNDPYISNTAGNNQLIAREAIASELYMAYFVPEPATLMVLGIGAGLVLRRRK
jgi:hypothetical protein